MDAEKCRYGKEHSLVGVHSDYNYINLCMVEVKHCEVCGTSVKTVYDIKNGKFIEKYKTIKMPQIAKEVLAAEQKKGSPEELRYGKDYGFIGEGGGI